MCQHGQPSSFFNVLPDSVALRYMLLELPTLTASLCCLTVKSAVDCEAQTKERQENGQCTREPDRPVVLRLTAIKATFAKMSFGIYVLTDGHVVN